MLSGPDLSTITSLRAGDSATFESLFLEYHKRLWAFAYDLTNSTDTADDIVQDVFATLWARRQKWEVQNGIAAYLFGAVRNLAYKRRRHDTVEDKVTSLIDVDTVPAMGEAPTEPGSEIDTENLVARLEAAIQQMPEGRREALILRWREEMSYDEIAQVMGISSKAVSVQITRARQDLRPLLSALNKE